MSVCFQCYKPLPKGMEELFCQECCAKSTTVKCLWCENEVPNGASQYCSRECFEDDMSQNISSQSSCDDNVNGDSGREGEAPNDSHDKIIDPPAVPADERIVD